MQASARRGRQATSRSGVSPLLGVLSIGILIIVGTASVAVYMAPSKGTTQTNTVYVTSTATTEMLYYTTSLVQQTATSWVTNNINQTSTLTATLTATLTTTSTTTSTATLTQIFSSLTTLTTIVNSTQWYVVHTTATETTAVTETTTVTDTTTVTVTTP